MQLKVQSVEHKCAFQISKGNIGRSHPMCFVNTMVVIRSMRTSADWSFIPLWSKTLVSIWDTGRKSSSVDTALKHWMFKAHWILDNYIFVSREMHYSTMESIRIAWFTTMCTISFINYYTWGWCLAYLMTAQIRKGKVHYRTAFRFIEYTLAPYIVE